MSLNIIPSCLYLCMCVCVVLFKYSCVFFLPCWIYCLYVLIPSFLYMCLSEFSVSFFCVCPYCCPLLFCIAVLLLFFAPCVFYHCFLQFGLLSFLYLWLFFRCLSLLCSAPFFFLLFILSFGCWHRLLASWVIHRFRFGSRHAPSGLREAPPPIPGMRPCKAIRAHRRSHTRSRFKKGLTPGVGSLGLENAKKTKNKCASKRFFLPTCGIFRFGVLKDC